MEKPEAVTQWNFKENDVISFDVARKNKVPANLVKTDPAK